MLKLGIIGSYGGHVRFVLEGPGAEQVDLVAASRWGSDDPMIYLEQFPEATKDVPIYDDYRKMLDEAKPDVVGVFMPLYRNAEASIAAAEAGCHIFAEKPLATTLDDLATLRKTVDDNGVKIIAAMGMRAMPTFLATRDVVQQGRIGEPVLASGQKSYPFANRDEYYNERKTYGGSIPWQAIHAIDFISYCTGKGYSRVIGMQSNVATPQRPGMEDNGGLLFELDGGGHAIVSFDFLRPWGAEGRSWGDDRLRIVGSEGIVEVLDGKVQLLTPEATEDVPLPAAKDIFGDFIATIGGQGDGLVTQEESFRVTEICLKARDAADTGKIVDL